MDPQQQIAQLGGVQASGQVIEFRLVLGHHQDRLAVGSGSRDGICDGLRDTGPGRGVDHDTATGSQDFDDLLLAGVRIHDQQFGVGVQVAIDRRHRTIGRTVRTGQHADRVRVTGQGGDHRMLPQ